MNQNINHCVYETLFSVLNLQRKKEPVQGIKTFRVNNFFPLTQNHKRQASSVLIIDNKGKIMEKTRLHGALTGRVIAICQFLNKYPAKIEPDINFTYLDNMKR